LGRAQEGAPALCVAAADNNLGIFHHYRDELDEAGAALKSGIEAAGAQSIVLAYLETNLGLVLVSRSLIEPAHLDGGGRVLGGVVGRLPPAGPLPGLAYALSNRALPDLARGRLDEATTAFEETIRLTARLGEKWPAYGAAANLALVEARRPTPDLERA